MARINVGDIVVYLKEGSLAQLGKNRKQIWRVTGTTFEDISLISIVDDNKRFITDVENVVSMKAVEAADMDKATYFNGSAWDAYQFKYAQHNKFKQEYEVRFDNNVGDTKMKSKDMVKRTVDANAEASKVAAEIATGRTVTSVVAKQLRNRKVLPLMVRGYADTAIGTVVIANLVGFAVKQFAAENAKFNYVSNEMMQAAMVDLLSEFDFEAIMNDVLSNVSLGDIAEQE